jgi:hypothetical protein
MNYNFYFWRFQTLVQTFRVWTSQTCLHETVLASWRSWAELPRQMRRARAAVRRGCRPDIRATPSVGPLMSSRAQNCLIPIVSLPTLIPYMNVVDTRRPPGIAPVLACHALVRRWPPLPAACSASRPSLWGEVPSPSSLGCQAKAILEAGALRHVHTDCRRPPWALCRGAPNPAPLHRPLRTPPPLQAPPATSPATSSPPLPTSSPEQELPRLQNRRPAKPHRRHLLRPFQVPEWNPMWPYITLPHFPGRTEPSPRRNRALSAGHGARDYIVIRFFVPGTYL